jgi:hypothetical protein
MKVSKNTVPLNVLMEEGIFKVLMPILGPEIDHFRVLHIHIVHVKPLAAQPQ